MSSQASKRTVSATFQLRDDVVRRIEQRAHERGISLEAALEEIVETAIPEFDPVARLREVALELRQAGTPANWRPFGKDELHREDS